ncbi:hypothetical protein TPHA_0A02490 [Tetrapisispora phaffii CBS 4417]|uniref:Uncharacterized protein n=1 Tax=Tetrapisispora phaffii (strain ATCC 24235 / CBS 4417 / NBRC 1672 / NRRL Y-8282 / UCD 70-5) TaxID=1071381 RepID=G8BN54_TETPH|nr:hypothetical protein TPHA_0A02490 [Tetrapisispora phaffii CBS 4417]CCE61332.1 hypothetical protein TPHA_0A02490 [Tetrapisispora phaffii CBS 4417]
MFPCRTWSVKRNINWVSITLSLFALLRMDIDVVILYLEKISYLKKLQLTSLMKFKNKIHFRHLDLNKKEESHFNTVFSIIEQNNELIKGKDKCHSITTIASCLNTLENSFDKLSLIKTYILQRTDNLKDISIFLNDSNVMLLYEIWKYLCKNLNLMKFYFTLLFIKTKSTIMNNELLLLKKYILESNERDGYGNSVMRTIESFLEYFEDFLLELTAEITNIDNGITRGGEIDLDDKYNYYVPSLIQIQEYYDMSNFTCLLLDIQLILQRERFTDSFGVESLSIETNSIHSDPSTLTPSLSENIAHFENGLFENGKHEKYSSQFRTHRRLSSSEITEVSLSSPISRLGESSILQKEMPRLLKNFSTIDKLNHLVTETELPDKNVKKNIDQLLMLNSDMSSMNNFKKMQNSSLEKNIIKNLNLQNNILSNIHGLKTYEPTKK